MKRSEMILKIESLFNECKITLPFSNRALAIQVLDLIEEQKMKPPKKERKEKFCNNYDGSYYLNIYEWEAE